MFKSAKLLTALVLVGFVSFPVMSAEKGLPELVSDLSKLRDKAKKSRSADPWLLADMEKLIEQYGRKNSGLSSLLSVDFTKKTYRLKREWTILSGEAWIDRRTGLNLKPKIETSHQRHHEKDQSSEPEDVGAIIFGAILEEAFKMKKGKSESKTESVDEQLVDAAEIVKRVNIPQIFFMQTSFSTNHRDKRELDVNFSLFQSNRAKNGVQLVIAGDHSRSLSLIKVVSGRATTLKTVVLSDKRYKGQQQLSWEQNNQGEHQVFLNDHLVLKIRSRRFRHAFKEFSISNQGGKVTIPFVSIDG